MTSLGDLPGADLVLVGLEDVGAGRVTPEALLVEIAAPRLRELGLPVSLPHGGRDAEIRLYETLGAKGSPDPYGEYNALLRKLTSFVHALESRVLASSVPLDQ